MCTNSRYCCVHHMIDEMIDDGTLHVANSAAAGRGTQSDKTNAHPGNMRDAAIP